MLEVPWFDGSTKYIEEGTCVAVSANNTVVLGRVRPGGWSESSTSPVYAWGSSVAEPVGAR